MSLTQQLNTTTVARWGGEVLDNGARPVDNPLSLISSERARRRYFEVVLAELADRPPDAGRTQLGCTYQDLFRRAGHKSPSTLYLTFGRNAKKALVRRFPEEIQKAFGRADLVQNVVVELKTLSHWPYRLGWLEQLSGDDGGMRAAEALVRVLAEWAGQDRRLAALAGYLPPPSAVEDLGLLCQGRATPSEITAFLRQVLEIAAGPRATSPGDVLDLVHTGLVTVLHFDSAIYADGILQRLQAPLGEIKYLLPRLPAGEGARVLRDLTDQLDGLRATMRDAQ